MDPEKYYEHQAKLYCRLIGQEWHLGYWPASNLQEAITNLTGFMTTRLDLKPGTRVLDLGCGVGGGSCYLAEKTGCSVVGVSNSRAGLAEAERVSRERGLDARVTFQFGNALELPFADGHFDAVWSCEAIHNVAELDTVLAEVCRVLKPGGSVVLGDLFQLREPTPEQPVTHGLQKWGFNLRTSGDWIRGLERNGVSVRESVNIGPDVVPSLEVCTRLFSDEAKNHAEGTLERIICERTALATTDLRQHLTENEIGWGVWSGVKR